jgi:cytochrome c553
MTNPLVKDWKSIEKGKKIYQSLCASCHGKTGKGDVAAMQSLNPKPTNFTTEKFQSQTDGTIFWKLSEGRGMMAAYKNMLTEEERWNLVNYLRSLKSTGKTEKPVKPENKKKSPPSKPGVEAFPFTTLVNAKTTHIMTPKGFGLIIQHRFGATKFDEGFVTNFMGLDLAANMRFAFEIPFNNKLMFEIGRTRYGKFYDIGGKYLLMQQIADEKVPFSLAVYANVAITTEKEPIYSETATFDNGSKFDYKFYHRLYYDTQMIFSRKFNNRFSAQIAGELIWRNLAPYSKPKEKNYIIAVPVSIRYKLSIRSAIDLEIMPNSHHHTMPFSLGYEVASSGNHVFQITITNTDRILSQNIFTNPTIKLDKEGFMLGFNLIRYF